MIKRALIALLLLAMLSAMMTSCIAGGGEVAVRDLCWPVGAPLPKAEDFFEKLPDGYSARYAGEYSFNELKEYQIELILTDAGGLGKPP